MLGIIGVAVFFLVGLIVGTRLVLLHFRSHQVPELMAGLGLLGIGPFGFCIVSLGAIVFTRPPWQGLFVSSGLVIQGLGFLATACFTWLSFRRETAWAKALVFVFSGGLLATTVVALVSDVPAGEWVWWRHFDIWLRIGCLAWGAIESMRYWRIASHRLRVGIGEPVVAASFGAWGIGLTLGVLGFAVAYMAMLHGPTTAFRMDVQLMMSLCGVGASAGLYLAFLPPGVWIRFLERRQAARATA